jgi:hypothetical protein
MTDVLIKRLRETDRQRDTQREDDYEDGGRSWSDTAMSKGTSRIAVNPQRVGRNMDQILPWKL